MAGSAHGALEKVTLPAQPLMVEHRDQQTILADPKITHAKYADRTLFRGRDGTVLELAPEGAIDQEATSGTGAKYYFGGPNFTSRARHVDAIQRTRTWQPGTLTTDGNVIYLADPAAAEIGDMPGHKPFGRRSVRHHGAANDGVTSDLAAFDALEAASAADGVPFDPGVANTGRNHITQSTGPWLSLSNTGPRDNLGRRVAAYLNKPTTQLATDEEAGGGVTSVFNSPVWASNLRYFVHITNDATNPPGQGEADRGYTRYTAASAAHFVAYVTGGWDQTHTDGMAGADKAGRSQIPAVSIRGFNNSPSGDVPGLRIEMTANRNDFPTAPLSHRVTPAIAGLQMSLTAQSHMVDLLFGEIHIDDGGDEHGVGGYNSRGVGPSIIMNRTVADLVNLGQENQWVGQWIRNKGTVPVDVGLKFSSAQNGFVHLINSSAADVTTGLVWTMARGQKLEFHAITNPDNVNYRGKANEIYGWTIGMDPDSDVMEFTAANQVMINYDANNVRVGRLNNSATKFQIPSDLLTRGLRFGASGTTGFIGVTGFGGDETKLNMRLRDGATDIDAAVLDLVFGGTEVRLRLESPDARVEIGGNKVLGARQPALPVDASDDTTAYALINAIKDLIETHGLAEAA